MIPSKKKTPKVNDFHLGEHKETIKSYANEQEKKLSKQLNATLQPRSGAGEFRKGDMVVGNLMIDLKSTKGNNISVTEEMLSKLESDGLRTGKDVCLILNFTNSKKLKNKKWYVIPVE